MELLDVLWRKYQTSGRRTTQWIELCGLHIQVSIGKRSVGRQRIEMAAILNVYVEGKKGRGTFRRFIKRFERWTRERLIECTAVCSIMNKRLMRFLLTRSYKILDKERGLPDAYRFTKPLVFYPLIEKRLIDHVPTS